MYENFERLPQAERERILNVCMEEFAQKGYEQASTNAIVQKAGIPKGTLFFYFGNKKDLYLYVIDHAVKRYAEIAQQGWGDLPGDLFDRLLYLGRERMKFALEQPLVYRLFFNAYINAPEEVMVELREHSEAYYTASQHILINGLDHSRFKPGINVEEVIELIYLVLEGILSKYIPALQRLQPAASLELVEKITVECEDFFTMIRQGVYRQ
jgi:TetR/AcrR family transcriptional regulator